jgi:hypothetical protein
MRRLTTWIIFTVATNSMHGQHYEPLDVAKKIFGTSKFQQIDKYITGEYQGRPNGQDMPKGCTRKFMLLGQTGKTAVVNLTVLDSTGKGLDTYLHFEKDSVWKMGAFRSLAMTGMIEQAVQELENMTPQQVDELIEKSKNAKNGDGAIFKSREDFDFELGNSKLTLALNDDIVKHFWKNKAEFERLKDLALEEVESKKMDEERSYHLLENLKADYRKLLITSVSTNDPELGNSISFLIGGMVDNTVGYLFVKDKKDLPSMDPDRIIMIREIGNGWYIYKTT